MSKIHIKGIDITVSNNNGEEYINLTEIVKGEPDGEQLIKRWLSNKNTIEYLGVWEKLKNGNNFNLVEFDHVRNEAGTNRFTMSVKQWIERTNGIGLSAKSGRYGSGTYAHKDIALKFASWISPELELLIILEFQRLKQEEAKQLNQNWDLRRLLTKANYRLQTDAVKDVLIPITNLPKVKEGFVYAAEADLLYQAMYGYTSKQWKETNPELALNGGNMRDYASVHQLIVLNGLEVVNAELIRAGLSKEERFKILRKSAIQQLKSLQASKSIEDTDEQSPNRLQIKTEKITSKLENGTAAEAYSKKNVNPKIN